MSNQYLKLRRSAIPGKVPTTESIDFGEIALNTYDGLAFMKKSGSSGEQVVTIGSTTGAFTGSFSGSFTGSLFGTASNATTASYALNANTASYALQAASASFATTASYVELAQTASYVLNAISASYAATASSADDFLVRGTLTAQTIVVQTITSSQEYVTGSTVFGSLLSNTHQFTGSVSITGSLGINGVDYTSTSASFDSRITNNSASIASLSASFETFSGSFNTGSFNGLFTGSFTGSFTGNFSGSLANFQGTPTHIPFFSSSQVLDDSAMFQVDNGDGSFSIAINQNAVTTANPEALYVSQTHPTSFNIISGKGNLDNYAQLNIFNTNAGTNASSDVVATANNGDEFTNYIDMGINNQNYSGSLGVGNDAYLYSTGRHLHIGNASNFPLVLFAGGSDTDIYRKLQIDPNNQHELTGSLNISGSLIVRNGITGSLLGTSSFANNSTTASYALTASYSNTSTSASYALSASYAATTTSASYTLTATSASFASTASYINPLNQLVIITGSLIQGLEGNIATGDYSHAEGSITKAIGNYSHAEGDFTQAKGDYSHAEGQETIASGSYSHAEGYQTIALANHQHVQGQFNAVSSIPSAFIIGNGTDDGNRSNLIYAHDSTVEITGSLEVNGGITGSLQGTASWANNATSASYAATASSADDFTVRGTLTAQTIVAQTITSSTDFVTGSTRFGSLLTNTHQFTGSVSITGSLSVNGSDVILTNQTASMSVATASYVLNAVSSSFASTASNVQGGTATYVPLWNTNTSLTSSYLNQSGNILKTIYNGTDRGLTLDYNTNSFILGNPGVGNNTYLQVFDGGNVINVYSPNYTYFNDKVGVRIIPTNPGLAVSGALEITGPSTSKFINSNLEITGSLNVTNGITGSLLGTASFANNSTSASFASTASFVENAQTASYVLNAVSASFATSASLAQTASFVQTAQTASYVLNAISSSFATSASLAETASFVTLAQTASYVLNAQTASYVLQAVSASFATSASLAQTASYVLNAVSSSFASTASFVANAQTASYVLQAVSASFATSASLAQTASFVQTAQTASYVLNAISSSFATSTSLAETASFITLAQTASFVQIAQTASYVLNAISSSFAQTASFAPLYVLTSATSSMLAPYVLTSQTSSMSVATASYVLNAVSASFASTASFVQNAVSSSFASTASFVANAQTASYVLNAVSASFATSASQAQNAITASYADNFTVAGTLTAQTIVVQTITSSTDFVTGSTRFGSLLSNTHQFTGSVSITGSLTVANGVNNLTASNAVSASNAISASFATSASQAQNSSTASYVLNAVSSSFASTASFVQNAQTASFVQNAVSSSFASTASFVANAQTASYVLNAVSASFATSASQAQNATTASYVLNAVSASFATSASNAQTASYVLQAVSASFASTASFVQNAQTASYVLNAVSASYASNADLLDGKDSTVFATTGSNIFRGNQTVTGSLNITGSTTQIGNNTLLGNTTLSGSIIISGSSGPGAATASVQIFGDIRQTGYHRFDPVTTNIDQSISASYIYVSGSTNDLYFSQNGSGYANTTRLRWLEGNLYTGLLHGGLITTQSSTVYQISSGSGIIVDLNASLNDDPYPVVQFLQWGNLSASIAPLTASYQQAFVSIDSSGNIYQQGTPYAAGQFDTEINIGVVLFQNGSTINGVKTQPTVAYGFEQQQNIFNRAFGPLKLSGYTLAPSGSSTGSLIVASGTAYAPGSNYAIDPNNPSYTTDSGTNVSKIFRYRQSGSTWVYDTNGGAGYTAIDPTQYSDNGVLTAVPGGGSNREFSIQRVFYFPNSVAKAIVVYYGNATYASLTEATSNIAFEPFVEAPNTAANAIYLGAIIVRNNADFTVTDSYAIQAGGLFRSVGGSGGGGSVVTQTLSGLSDVSISGPTDGQALVYNTTSLKWENKSFISASISGNAATATSASFATTASFVAIAQTASYVLNAVSSSFATSASYALSASQAQNAVSASFATTAATASFANNFTVAGTLTAQTIVAQTITSSTDFVTGSTRFGSLLANTHQFTGSVSVTGSLAVNNSNVILTNQTASMSVATASYVLNAVSASFASTASFVQNAVSASYVLQAVSSSFASTASFINTLNQPVIISGSLTVFTGSAIELQVTNTGVRIGNAITDVHTVTGSLGVSGSVTATNFTGSLFGTASWASNALTASFVSNAQTASYVLNAVSASFATSASLAQTASYVLNAVSASFASTASSVNQLNQAVVISGSLTVTGSTNLVGSTGATLLSTNADTLIFTGSIFTSGSIIGTGSLSITNITSSLLGTASYATQALTASFITNAQTASYVLQAVSASFASQAANASTASFVTLAQTASYVLNAVSASFATNASTASFVQTAQTASYVLQAVSASFATQAANATTASFITTAQTASYVLNAVSASFASTASFAPLYVLTSATSSMLAPYVLTSQTSSMSVLSASFASTASSADNFTVRGTLTAQTIVAQTITSSVSFITGSTQFGSLLSNTHQFTGSVSVTGSLNVAGAGITGSLFGTSSWANNAITSSYILNAVSASFASTASFVPGYVSGSGASGQIAYFGGTNFATSSATLAFTPTSQLLVNNSITAAGAIARGTNLTPTLTAAANNDVLVGLDINPTFTNGAFTGVQNLALRVGNWFNLNNTDTSLNIINTTATASTRGIRVTQINDGAQAAAMGFVKARGTIASPTNVTTNDLIGAFTFNPRIAGSYTSDRSLFGANMATSTGIGLFFIASSADSTYTPSIYIHPTSNVIIGSSQSILAGITDSGFRLDVNGTARVQGNTQITGSLNISGSTIITGSLTATAGITGSLFGTASWASNALTASFVANAQTASYVLQAVSASFASTASFVNTLNQNVVITGSLTVGATSVGANENTLILGPAPAGGTGEGGQLLLQAPGGIYTSASMWDNWQNQTRLLRGTNASSDAVIASFNMHNGQASFPRYTGSGAFPGTATANLSIDSGGNIITTAIGSSVTGGTTNYIVRWASSTTLTTGSLFDNGTNVGVGTITPSYKLDVSGDVRATGAVYANANGTMYFRGGDDAELWDINVANTIGVYGQQDSTIASIKLGSGGGTISGRSGNIGIGTITPNSASLHVNGNVFATSFTGSLLGTATTASYVLNAVSSSFAATASSADNFTVRGTLTAQTIVAQTITSSVSFITGSTQFGSLLTNTHQFTGSVLVTGSLNVNGSDVILTNQTASMSVATASFATTATSAITAQTASFANNFTVASTLTLDQTLTDYFTVASSIVGANNLFTQATGSYTSAFFKYSATNGTNTRAGEVVAAWNGTTVSFYDNSTVDIGTTAAVTASVSVVSSNVQFNITTNSSGWRLKSLATFM